MRPCSCLTRNPALCGPITRGDYDPGAPLSAPCRCPCHNEEARARRVVSLLASLFVILTLGGAVALTLILAG